jgi:hypothetical protein
VSGAGKLSRRHLPGAIAIAAGLIFALAAEIAWTAPMRGAVRTYHALLAAANRQPEPDADAAGRLCSSRFRRVHGLWPARAGGFIGLPRSIHKNFQVWRHGRDVWLCPTNRAGPVYRFVREEGRWKFDGLVGQLLPTGRVLAPDEAEAAEVGLD